MIKKKILITGGAGFIGSNFIRYFLDKHTDYKVINCDLLTYAGNLDNLKDIKKNPRYEFVKCDIRDDKKIRRLTKKVTAIINFAAETHVDRSILDAGEFVDTNIKGTQVLLEAVKANSISRFIHISTDEVYGSINNGSFSESSPIRPNSPYAASKAAADLLVCSYFITYKTPAIITRSSNNFGPYQYPEKMIPLFITNLMEGKKVPLYGDGLNIRDWIFVLDNCRAIDLVLQKGKVGEVYNIGGDNEKNNLELTHLILKLLGRNKNFIKYVKDRPGHDRRYSLNSQKVKALGFKPRFGFKDALKETILWYEENRNWWQRIKNKKQQYKQYYRKQYRKR